MLGSVGSIKLALESVNSMRLLPVIMHYLKLMLASIKSIRWMLEEKSNRYLNKLSGYLRLLILVPVMIIETEP